MSNIVKIRTKTHKTCNYCGKLVPIEKFGKRDTYCNKCKYQLYNKNREDDDFFVPNEPGVYRKKEHFEMVYEFLNLLGWKYDSLLNTFYKEGIKDKNNNWLFQSNKI